MFHDALLPQRSSVHEASLRAHWDCHREAGVCFSDEWDDVVIDERNE